MNGELSCEAARVFPGRRIVTTGEIASALRCTPTHVGHLIAEGAIAAIDLAAESKKRRAWRVPVVAYDRFLRARFRPALGGVPKGPRRCAETALGQPDSREAARDATPRAGAPLQSFAEALHSYPANPPAPVHRLSVRHA